MAARLIGRTTGRPSCGFFLFLLLATASCTSNIPNQSDNPVVLTVGVAEGAGTPPELGVFQFVRMVAQEGLTQINPDGRVVPRLASGWRWENDGLRLRVFLRPDVRFHDGKHFTAPGAAATLAAMTADRRNWAGYPSLEQVTHVRAEGDLEIVFDLSERSAFLLEDLSASIRGDADGVGTGPFRVASNTESETVLERFDNYYQGQPAIRRIVVRPFEELRTTWASLLRGELDMVTDVPPNTFEFIRNDDDIDVVSWQRWYQFMVAFNSARGPLSSAAVRRALNIAVDREALVGRVLRGAAKPSTGPIWPDYWAYDSSVPPYTADEASAASLLDAAGYPAGRARSRTGFPHARFRFTCLIPAGYSVHERIGLELQRQLYEIGVDMQFEAIGPDEFEERLLQGNFDAVLLDMISGPSPGRTYTFWRSARKFKGRNVFGYENPLAERLFTDLRTSVNDAAMLTATSRLQRVLLDDPPALFLAWNQRSRAVRRSFNVHQEAGRDPLSTLWRWTPAGSIHNASTP
jgi:peptide/nickel transport system substrate-binding protein